LKYHHFGHYFANPINSKMVQLLTKIGLQVPKFWNASIDYHAWRQVFDQGSTGRRVLREAAEGPSVPMHKKPSRRKPDGWISLARPPCPLMEQTCRQGTLRGAKKKTFPWGKYAVGEFGWGGTSVIM
jgi:hypothetical protein